MPGAGEMIVQAAEEVMNETNEHDEGCADRVLGLHMMPGKEQQMTRWEQDVIRSAKANHIWVNAFSLIRPTDKTIYDIGRAVVEMLKSDENLILCDYDGTPLESLKQKELVLSINQS
jgi:hypothetical protein